MSENDELSVEVPTVEDYCRLRIAAGLTARIENAARLGLPNTVVGVVVRNAGRAIGIGRAIGDGLFYQLVNIAVDPAHQGRGLGKSIVSALMAELKRIAPAEAYISLIADGEANRLYSQYGFTMTAPASVGMAQWIGK